MMAALTHSTEHTYTVNTYMQTFFISHNGHITIISWSNIVFGRIRDTKILELITKMSCQTLFKFIIVNMYQHLVQKIISISKIYIHTIISNGKINILWI